MSGGRPSRRRKVLSIWHDTPDWLRTTTGFSISIALGLFIIGVIADARNWAPSEWGYFVNLYSSITAFFVAVPIALIGLDAITETRRTQAERLKVDNQTVKAWDRFQEAVHEFCAPEVMELFRTLPMTPFNAYTFMRNEIRRYAQDPGGYVSPSRGLLNPPLLGPGPVGFVALRHLLHETSVTVQESLNQIQSTVLMDRDVQIKWSALRSAWRYFSIEITARRDELDLPTPSHHLMAILDDRTSGEQHPLVPFYRSYRRTAQVPYRAETMGDVPSLISSLMSRSEQDLVSLVTSSSLNPFSRDEDGAEEFVMATVEASGHLRELLAVVDRINIRQVVDAS